MAGLAANMIGMIYCDEQDDAEKAFDWALKGAEEGFDAAMSNLGGMYRRGHGVKKNLDKAIEWYQKAYELHGDDAGFAAYQLAGIYSDEENVVKKWEWTEKSAQEGYDEAMLDIGLRYDGDDELSEDLDQAMEWYQKAYAQHGSVAGDAAILIAMIYERKDQEEKAFEWYSKGAEEGNENAMYFLAQSYEYGAGVQANREKAIEWYQKVVDCHGDEEEEAKEHLQALLKEIEEG
jgi:TPR repeat protein